MSYSRWGCGEGKERDWYIFWIASNARSVNAEQLALWHCDHQNELYQTSFLNIMKMLKSGDYSEIPGYTEDVKDFLKAICKDWIWDVNDHYVKRPGGKRGVRPK